MGGGGDGAWPVWLERNRGPGAGKSYVCAEHPLTPLDGGAQLSGQLGHILFTLRSEHKARRAILRDVLTVKP